MNPMLPAPENPPINLVLRLIDLLQHESTAAEEREAGVHALNRVCKGQLASVVISAAMNLDPKEMRRAIDSVNVARLLEQSEVSQLLDQIRSLEKQNEELARRIANLAKQTGEDSSEPQEKPTVYPISDLITAMAAAKDGNSYGWKTDYVKASHNTPGARPVEHHHILKWQKLKFVPAWAYEQVSFLQFRKRVGKKSPNWKREEYQWLADEYNANPKLTNAELARRFTAKFNRPMNENGIKGGLNRSNDMGLIFGLRREMHA